MADWLKSLKKVEPVYVEANGNILPMASQELHKIAAMLEHAKVNFHEDAPVAEQVETVLAHVAKVGLLIYKNRGSHRGVCKILSSDFLYNFGSSGGLQKLLYLLKNP